MYEKILIPVDDLKSSEAAIANGKAVASLSGAEVILLHVVSPENPLVLHDDHLGGVHAAAEIVEIAKVDEARRVAEQEAILAEAVAGFTTVGVKFTPEVAVGSPRDEILRVVKERGIDLIIISTHGRRGVTRALLGSVAEEVMRAVDVPVMVVRRAD